MKWLKNIIRKYGNGPYIQCTLCEEYKDVRNEVAYLDNTGYFCLMCAQTKDFIDLKIRIRTSMASLNAYYWEPNCRMIKKYKRIMNDLRKIRRLYKHTSITPPGTHPNP